MFEGEDMADWHPVDNKQSSRTIDASRCSLENILIFASCTRIPKRTYFIPHY
jgi:hypothetical protein